MSTQTQALPNKIDVLDWGRTAYVEAFEYQRRLVEQRLKGILSDTLVFTEHDPVFTVGQRKGADKHLIWEHAKLKKEGINLIYSNRGGDITYHGPGQVVGYAIISLNKQRDLHAYLRKLEEVIICTLSAYGLKASRREGKTGIWLETRKICAIGVAVRTWVTYHGFALNIDPNMDHFSGIIPCGITDGEVTSLRNELDKEIEINHVKKRLAVEFRKVFQNSK